MQHKSLFLFGRKHQTLEQATNLRYRKGDGGYQPGGPGDTHGGNRIRLRQPSSPGPINPSSPQERKAWIHLRTVRLQQPSICEMAGTEKPSASTPASERETTR